MATDKQIQANRRNARRSTGPKTEQGKARSRTNALRHGLTAELAVLPHEDPRDYDEIRTGFIDSHAPKNSAELALVEELANAYWRLLRLHRVETQYWEHLGGCYNRGDAGVAEALVQSPETHMRNFFRYYTQVERSYYRALAAVNQIRRDKGKGRSTQTEDAAAAASNGFVSQSGEHAGPAADHSKGNPLSTQSIPKLVGSMSAFTFLKPRSRAA